MSSDWSFGNRGSPCSQSRKISIGIMVDSLKKGTDCSRKYEMEATALSEVNSKLGDAARRKHQQKEGSPWVKPKSNCKKSLISEGDSRLQGDGRRRDKTSSKLDKLKGPPPDEPIKFYSRNASIFTSKGTGEKRPDYQKTGENKQNTDSTEKHFLAFGEGVSTADKVPAGDQICSTVNKRSENLRMKLCELMGDVFSPEKNQTSLPPMDVGITPLKSEPNSHQANNVSIHPKPNSDTIESDSENPGGSRRRAVNRSITGKMARKRAPAKKLERITRSTHKDQWKESNAYLFGGGRKVAQSSTRKNVSSTLKQKNSIPVASTMRKFTWDEPHISSYPLEENENEIQEEACKTKSAFLAGRSFGVKPHNSSSLTLEDVDKDVRPGAVVTQRDPLELLERKLDDGNAISVNKLTENVATGNHLGTKSAFKSSADQRDYFASPTIGSRTPLMSASPDSSCKDDQTKQGTPSVAEAIFNLESMLAHGNFTSKDTHTKQREQPGAGNDDCDSEDSTASDSDSSNEGDTDSIGKDPGEEETLSPELVTVKKPISLLHRPKRLHSLRDTNPYAHRLSTHASKGKGIKTTSVKQDSGEFQVQDEFSRAVGPLAVSLEKMKNKVKLVTANKSSEILNSLATNIQAHMQNVESQIQSDMGKLKSFSKQKRKFLDREFHEQEKQLKLIHERFQKELGQHVQHCLETAEDLEENKKELKKILEKQKASHKKLLMQVEQAAQTEIHDAEKRISNMNKLAREQMLQLRLLIEQYLGEGMMC